MDESTRASRAAPLSCLEEAPTPGFAEEIPAPGRDPPPSRAAPSTAEVPAPRRSRPAPRSLAGLAPLAKELEGVRPLVESVLRRAGVPGRDVADVVQDLLIALLPKWGERADWPPGKRASYVAGAARRVARRFIARAARRGEVLVSARAMRDLLERAARDAEERSTPEDLLLSQDLWSERGPDARLAFLEASMAPAFWRVYHAHVLLGIPATVIARTEQAPLGTIYNRLRLARRYLHAAIARDRAARLPLFV